jgi:hypothetical protein
VSTPAGDARAFAESVAGVATRTAPATPRWEPGQASEPWPGLEEALQALDWMDLAADAGLADCAALGAAELGRRAAPLSPIDALLGGSPPCGELVRCLVASGCALVVTEGTAATHRIGQAEPLPAADGLEVHRITELGPPLPLDPAAWEAGRRAWLSASVGYLAGVGLGALELAVPYVRDRTAFGTTLSALPPVQQLLAEAAVAVRGVVLLSTADPDADALAFSGQAIAQACAACQQVTGAIGFTLDYPLHRFTQRARALAVWNDALLEALSL